ncbi:hypothetical protein BK658_21575 [Pseudomonas brassicacearum]|uniref:Uncharacterized protein n=1 Tax=Pseudomonas brassicacearum TaxID=930166 RepID=A0A423GM35_9PSED|nr:hypothetical protein BK658_21575 [Pseudomonas brassicacearum]
MTINVGQANNLRETINTVLHLSIKQKFSAGKIKTAERKQPKKARTSPCQRIISHHGQGKH